MNRSYILLTVMFLLMSVFSACESSQPSEINSTGLGHGIPNENRATPTVSPTVDAIQEILVRDRKVRGKLKLPTVINSQDRFINPAEVSEEILQFIRNISDLQQDCKESTQAIVECFAIVQVDLNEDSFSDFVLFGRGRNGGANITPFYVLTGASKGFDSVLEESTLVLEITSTKTRGYFDIKTFAATSSIGFTNVYSFDGKDYKIKRKFQENL